MKKLITKIIMYFLEEEFLKFELRLSRQDSALDHLIEIADGHESSISTIIKKSKIKL